MSNLTNELNLFKYNTSTDGKQVFSIDTAMNDNWDKIDAFATAIKSLSNLNELGEKRFNDINTQLGKKLEADVLLEENGYIKFNNKLILQWGYNWIPYTELTLTFPITFKTNPRIYGTACGADSCILNVMATYKDRCILDYPSSAQGGCNWLALGSI